VYKRKGITNGLVGLPGTHWKPIFSAVLLF